MIDATTQSNIDRWLNGNYDEETKAEIRKLLREDQQAAIDAFYTTLTFGTGGLRGISGIGSNRINKYTVRSATQGLANYIKKQPCPDNGYHVVIGYDSRSNSRALAEETAKVLAGNAIHVHIFRELRPTPLVSFACRHLHCIAGVMITASHNPPKYNGYKVYWSDGGQVVEPNDTGIIREVNAITDQNAVHIAALDSPFVHWPGFEIDEAYFSILQQRQLYPEHNHSHGQELQVVYSSLHGTGITLLPELLDRWGFSNLRLVESQCEPDGSFPTVESPNPEEHAALELGIRELEILQADILIATDPDADRVGVAVRHEGRVVLLNGNQIAALCVEHICKALQHRGALTSDSAFIKTIVTTELFRVIVSSYGASCFDVLTGFKFIAQQIKHWEDTGAPYRFIFGGEESYGYLLGDQTRDKDAIISAALICEVALQAKLQGRTLVDMLNDIYVKYGFYLEALESVKFPETKEGREAMARSVEKLIKQPPRQLASFAVKLLYDYTTGRCVNMAANSEKNIDLPKTSLMIFECADGSRLMVRPSGTEPKIKIYCGVRGETEVECENKIQLLLKAMQQYLQ